MTRDRRPALIQRPMLTDPNLRRPEVRHLIALVDRFGPDAVGDWQHPPRGWSFLEWLARD